MPIVDPVVEFDTVVVETLAADLALVFQTFGFEVGRFTAGGAFAGKPALAVTYGVAVTIVADTGNRFIVTATNNTAFAFGTPLNPTSGQRMVVTIRNTSGGALGVATWGAVFKMAAWTQPATGFSRSIEFEYDGANWVELFRSANDVPN